MRASEPWEKIGLWNCKYMTNVFCSVLFERVLVLLLEYLQNYVVLVHLGL